MFESRDSKSPNQPVSQARQSSQNNTAGSEVPGSRNTRAVAPFVPSEIDQTRLLKTLQPRRPEKLNVKAVLKSLEVVANTTKDGVKRTGFIAPGASATTNYFQVKYQNGNTGAELKLSRQQPDGRFLDAWGIAPAAVALTGYVVALVGMPALPYLAGAGVFAGIAGFLFKAQRQEAFKNSVKSHLESLKGNKHASAEKMMIDTLAAYSMVQKLPWLAHTYNPRLESMSTNRTPMTILEPLLSAMQVVAKNWDTLRAQPSKQSSRDATNARETYAACVKVAIDYAQDLEGAYNRTLKQATFLHTVCGVGGAACWLVDFVGPMVLSLF